jgi:2-isopropylmalate synthase
LDALARASYNSHEATKGGDLMVGRSLTIFDTTLRDGEQAPGFSMRTDEKLKLARQIARLGADVIEAGFPIASEADAEAVRLVATHVRGPVIAALARCHAADIERAAWALAPAERRRIHVFIATSDLHLERKLRMSRAECLRAAMQAVALARKYTDDVQFSAEDATRSDPEFLWRIVEGVIQSGAKTINLPDTVGYSTPDEISDFFAGMIGRVPSSDQVTWSTHCHDDLGLAVANTLAALSGGARQVECTINGIGERAGNASLEEVVMATRVRSDRLPFDTRIDAKEIFATSQLLTGLTGESVQANKAIVGRNAFAHEAGIHQDGMLKDRRTYEIMRPEEVGVPEATLVLGKHSGRHAVQRRCEQIGVTLTRHELDQVYRAVIALADREKVVNDADLRQIVTRLRESAPATPHAGASATPDFSLTPAESGYGHGV